MAEKKRIELMVCAGTGCVAGGAFQFKQLLEQEITDRGLGGEVAVVTTGCNGFCGQGPLMVVVPDNIFYGWLTPNDIPLLVEEHFLKGRPVQKLMFTPPEEETPIPLLSEIPFFNKQVLIVLKNRGLIDPENITDYIARDGYVALEKVLTSMEPEEVIEEVLAAGLRGRGGAGFPTGLKWRFARNAVSEDDEKYIICNADEGDPGAFMDRSVLESDPHAIVEGMLIGAHAIGATHGFIYVRDEYPIAVKRVTHAIDEARAYGLLGEDILKTGFDFDLSVNRGAGAFVCGEETSLINSLEGKMPEPKVRPPYPANSGYMKRPTNINNVESWANIRHIINNGAEWFNSIGTEKSKGTKIFSLVGKVKNTGLVEVPMGITLREIIFDMGGGIVDDKKFKAVQTGGPSGGCIPASLLDISVDYESLAKVGAIVGSGGMIVMDERSCMVEVAKYFLTFSQGESCGKCTPCREGIRHMLNILTEITEGRGQEGDIETLEKMANLIKETSLCALGGTAPNSVLTTIKYFRHEYEAHIKEKRCPAVVCKEIISSACQHSCPIAQDAACYIGLIAHRRFKEALEITRKENPLPLICGRVCHNPCEVTCKAGEGGDAITIRSLKRFLADYDLEHGINIVETPKQKREERIAVIGAGPGGLTCAHYLALEGYNVTIFESQPQAGGMLTLGIPEFRLPKKFVNLEIDRIKALGVELKTDTTVGKDILFPELKKEYAAIFIATGAHKGIRMEIPGEDMEGVLDAVEFLRDVNLGRGVKVGEKVIVVGGGNSAVDAARVVKRLGKDIKMFYRRTQAEMPAIESEVHEIFIEGIDLQFLVTPVKIISSNGKLEAVECVKMELGATDLSGRRRPVPIPGSEFRVDVDTLILAIGQRPDVSFLADEDGLQISKWESIVVDPETLYTNIDGVFAGGDAVTGPSTVTDAMGHGKLAATMIRKYINKEKLEREYKVTRPGIHVEPIQLSEEEMENITRPEMAAIPVEQRIGSFDEVELGFTEAEAVAEAKRCLRCDLLVENN